LFREEVAFHRQSRLHGHVIVAVPHGWQIAAYGLFFSLIAAMILIGSTSYGRAEVVRGRIVVDQGTVEIVPGRGGTVTDVAVREGDEVRRGAELVRIRAEEDLQAGGSAPSRILAAMNSQEETILTQATHAAAASEGERVRLRAQANGLAQEVRSLNRQIEVQRALLANSQNEVELIQTVAQRGYVSRRSVLEREETLLVRRQQLAQLEQQQISKQAELSSLAGTIRQSEAQAQAQTSSLQAARFELAQRRADVQARRGYLMKAPVAGRVSAVTARPGQTAATGQVLMAIVPANASLRAELLVPTRAAGFLRRNQEVKLAIDAFPYERFGTLTARIVSISATVVPRSGDDEAEPAYLVTALLDQRSFQSANAILPLRPGMTLTARIVTDRRTLFQWLFAPLSAALGT
jgi:membrane fusion protein